MEVRLTVWQFVRLMVHLEDAPAPAPEYARLLAAWRDAWDPLDRELGDLAERDADAYGEMMMDQDVVFEDATPEQTATAARALEAVVAELDAAIAKGGEAELLESLKFERRELRQLARKLARAGDAA